MRSLSRFEVQDRICDFMVYVVGEIGEYIIREIVIYSTNGNKKKDNVIVHRRHCAICDAIVSESM